MAENEKYIQVGVTALRDPVTGAFLPAVPLYIKVEEGTMEAAEVAQSEEKLMQGISHLLALRMKQYMDNCRKAGVGL